MTTTQPDSLAGQILPDRDYRERALLTDAPSLRDTVFFGGSAHPDAGPCPDWCQYTEPPAAAHGIEYGQPVAHTSTTLHSRASLYRGADEDMGSEGERHLFATIETRTEVVEGCAPEIRVALRDHPHVMGRGSEQRLEEKLLLTIADARELAAVLTYWADAAEDVASV